MLILSSNNIKEDILENRAQSTKWNTLNIRNRYGLKKNYIFDIYHEGKHPLEVAAIKGSRCISAVDGLINSTKSTE